jgi:uncharacterized protein (DUF1810 family)
MQDEYNLDRFTDAQDPVYKQVCAELRQGRKTSHWMWFVFPQIEGLGHSPTARHFAISSLAEARAYLTHPTLGPRLIECTKLVVWTTGLTIQQIFGYPDYLKFRSCMTLFAKAMPDNPIFVDALRKYFDGEGDNQTVSLLACGPL